MNAAAADDRKRWFKIGETAKALGISPKDLRYWESVIPEIRPRRSKGNLRYYHADELPRLTRIRDWIREGFSAVDCRGLLISGQVAPPLDLGLAPEDLEPSAKARRPAPGLHLGASLQPAIQALRGLLQRLGGASPAVSEEDPPPAAPKRAPKRKAVLDPPPSLF